MSNGPPPPNYGNYNVRRRNNRGSPHYDNIGFSFFSGDGLSQSEIYFAILKKSTFLNLVCVPGVKTSH